MIPANTYTAGKAIGWNSAIVECKLASIRNRPTIEVIKKILDKYYVHEAHDTRRLAYLICKELELSK